MELKIKKNRRSFQPLAGFFSFLIALVALAGLNASLLFERDVFPDFFIIKLPIIGLAIGFIGLWTKRRSKMYAYWGISLNVFILIFTFLMIGISWTLINPKP